MADGHVNKCKECNKADVTENRNLKHDYYIDYDRKRSRKLPTRTLTEQPAEVKRAYRKAWELKFPERKQAATAVANAIRDGKLERPDNCEFCGKECKPHAHHSSYAKDMQLLVTWLCISCHKETHWKD
jgi:hypothetical protein